MNHADNEIVLELTEGTKAERIKWVCTSGGGVPGASKYKAVVNGTAFVLNSAAVTLHLSPPGAGMIPCTPDNTLAIPDLVSELHNLNRLKLDSWMQSAKESALELLKWHKEEVKNDHR